MTDKIKKIQKIVVPVLKRHKIKSAALFGSYARGEDTVKSDVDILIDFTGQRSLLDLSGIKIDLEDALNKQVDLVPKNAVYPRLMPYIIKDLYPLY